MKAALLAISLSWIQAVLAKDPLELEQHEQLRSSSRKTLKSQHELVPIPPVNITVVGTLTEMRLVNTKTKKPISTYNPLRTGDLIDFAVLGDARHRLTIEAEAEVKDPYFDEPKNAVIYTGIDFVAFEMDGRKSFAQFERKPPYVLCGNRDIGTASNSSISLLNACPAEVYFDEGAFHRVTATPYWNGTAGESLSVWYQVGDSSTPPPVLLDDDDRTSATTTIQLVLVDADSNLDIKVLRDRTLVDLNVFPRISIRADVTPYFATKSVVFEVGNDVVQVENIAPYTLRGNRGLDYWAWTGPTQIGMTYISATAYSELDGKGEVGPQHDVAVMVLTPF